MAIDQIGAGRRARLSAARLYLVCGASPAAGALPDVLRAAIAGGVDIFQLREKLLPDAELIEVARTAGAVCAELGALFILNDRPDLARAAGADGVHVGQDDMPVAQARELIGPELLLGLSTHAPAEIDAVAGSLVDYIGVGPVHATPTKLGRAAVGAELLRYAAAHATVPFFAIGGLDSGNVGDAIASGAQRICVLRAIADAQDVERAARALRGLLDRRADGRLPSGSGPA
jgi:thiamine-phosphate pyrophosphorylase